MRRPPASAPRAAVGAGRARPLRSLTVHALPVLVLSVLALLLVPTAAHAYAPTGDDFITCTADGSSVDCVAGIFAAGCETALETSTGFTDTVTASVDGEVAFAFEVPADHGDGDIRVTLRCDQGGTKILSDVIAAVEDGEVIAITGFDTIEMVALGAVAIVFGAGILAVTRPGRSSRRAGSHTTA